MFVVLVKNKDKGFYEIVGGRLFDTKAAAEDLQKLCTTETKIVQLAIVAEAAPAAEAPKA